MEQTQNTDDLDYSFPKVGKSKLITSLIAIFLLGIIIYFPFMFKIKSVVKEQLNHIPGCAVDYDDIHLEFLLPKLIVRDLAIPQSCFGQHGAPLRMDNVYLYFRGLSFSPFGPHFKIETNLNGIPLSSYLSAGIGGVALNVKDNEFELNKVSKTLPAINLAGKIKLDLLARMKGQNLSDLKLKIESKDFTLPGQNIQGFKLATMRLNNLLIKADMAGKKVKVSDFIVGDQDAPIRANFRGDLAINQRNFTGSQLNLKGEVAFAQSFLEKYSIIKLVMAKFDKKDEFYQIKLTGPLSSPKPTSAR